ncbi:MAG: Gfo/Idh/MocA family oxidoreductase [Acidobacteriota bacterium]
MKASKNPGAAGSSRRDFLGKTAAILAGAAVAPAGVNSAAAVPAPAVATAGRILGANDRANVAFIGCGMQFLALLGRAFRRRKQEKNDFEYAAVCDVWQPRLDYAQTQTQAERTFRDYREVLARPEIDGVVIAVPDHWHYRIASEALHAGKDVYLEKPLTYTIEEAAKLHDEVAATKRVLQVGGSGVLDRLNWKIHEYIQAGKMGKILWGLISYNRNTREGMWDYPIPGVGSTHWPDAKVAPGDNLDWEMWLGPAPKRPFSAERYFRWRKYWDYSGGNATDLLYHRLGAMLTMVGFDFPARVTGAGGIYVQKNREVPDTYMTLVEYPGDFTINMISCMANASSSPVTVYGNWGTLEITRSPVPAGDAMGDQTRGPQTPRERPRTVAVVKAERTFLKEFQEANEGKEEVTIDAEDSPDLVDDWLDCMRSRKDPVYNILRGYQVMVAIKLGVDSYRQGRVLAFDPKSRQVIYPPERKEYLPADA